MVIVICRSLSESTMDTFYKYRNHRWDTDDKRHRIWCMQDAVHPGGLLLLDEVMRTENIAEVQEQEYKRLTEWISANKHD